MHKGETNYAFGIIIWKDVSSPSNIPDLSTVKNTKGCYDDNGKIQFIQN